MILRWWGLRLGLEKGSKVGNSLENVNLSHLAERVRFGGTLLLGILSGVLLGSHLTGANAGWLWGILGIFGFGVGHRFGARAPRLSSLILVGVVGLLIVLRIQ